jgi:transposase-like protein
VPKALDPRKRAAILADIKAGKQRNEIARAHDVSGSTVTKIAADEGLKSAFDRSQTEKATRARIFDAKAARAQLVEDLLRDAQRFRARAWDPYTQIVSGPLGAELVTTKMPPLRDQQSGYTSIGICIDKAAKLSDIDAGDGSAGARSLLGRLGEALSVAADSFGPDPDPVTERDENAGGSPAGKPPERDIGTPAV